jgi:hypothetical protein
MILTQENYHSRDANWIYMGSSQYLDFTGRPARPACPAAALAQLKGEWPYEITNALLIGQYVDAHFSGTLDIFKAQHPEILRTYGLLKSGFELAERMIVRCERDEYFMKFLSGGSQVIMTAEMFGCLWKIKIDNYIQEKMIVDLKTTRSINKLYSLPDYAPCLFIEYWGYDTQMAIYQKVVELATGNQLPVYIAAVSKEPEPDIEIIQIDQQRMDTRLMEVEDKIRSVLDMKAGVVEAPRCNACNFCRNTKILNEPVLYV